MRRLITILFLLLCVSVNAQEIKSFGVAYYDVDRLYDTIPSRFYDDSAYTPEGSFAWDESRYRRKVEQVAAVVDSMELPVVALYGVENEQVVRDIVSACGEDYAYIHRTSNSYDGLDFALLYFADVFFPGRVTEYRGALCVEGEACGEPLTIIATHRSTSLGVLIEERNLLEDNNIIILGDVGKLKFKKYGLRDASFHIEKAARGNRILRGMWHLRDRVLTNITSLSHCDVYIKRWLLDETGVPRPTFDGAKYCAGGSSCLPIFIYFDK
ncbi:MAG: hypothetical protein E7138_01905 [Rikenellaceae bacterium]|nr:hypothetical protein [Rikenellaceae bacterium]